MGEHASASYWWAQNYLCEELVGGDHAGRETSFLSLFQGGKEVAALSDIDDGRRNDELNILQSLAEVVDDDVQLQLSNGADDVLACFLGVRRREEVHHLEYANAAVVVVEDAELVEEERNVVRFLRFHSDLDDGVALG